MMPFARTANPTPAALAKRVRRTAAEQQVAAHRTREGRWLLLFPGGRGEVVATSIAALELLAKRRRPL
jgi:hypothetical protein